MNCKLCQGMGVVRESVPVGHPNFGKVFPCECRNDDIQRRVATQSGLLESELEITLASINLDVAGPGTKKMVAMGHQFLKEPWGMWTIWGTYGNAKTMCLQALVNEWRQRGRQAVYVRFKDLLDWIKSGNKPGASIDALQRYRRMVDVWLLAIDEFDKFYLTDYVNEFRLTFLDDRWRWGVARDRHTLIAMNEDPATLPGSVHDRLRDDRFGCMIDGVWQPGITRNRDESLRPLARELA